MERTTVCRALATLPLMLAPPAMDQPARIFNVAWVSTDRRSDPATRHVMDWL
jgi:hypothetical protein